MRYLAVGNDELGDKVEPIIDCPHCNGKHKIESWFEDSKSSMPENLSLQTYKCGESSYVYGINGRKIK